MAKIRRNALCPCGSGKKYKRCCLSKDRRSRTLGPPGPDAVPLALSWLYRNHNEAMITGFAATVFAGLSHEDVVNLATAVPDTLAAVIEANGRELLLAEGKIVLDGVETACLDLVLGPGGPGFDAEQREYLETLGRRSMSFYRVLESKPGTGFELGDLLDEDEPVRWIEERVISQSLAACPGSIFGARLMPDPGVPDDEGEVWRLSCGAIYPLREPHASRLLKDVRVALDDPSGPFDERRIRSMFAVFGWLFPLSRTPASTYDSLLADMEASERYGPV